MLSIEEPITGLKFISSSYQKRLSKLNIFKIKDLLLHFPKEYIDTNQIVPLSEISTDLLEKNITILANVEKFSNIFLKTKKNFQSATLNDNTGKISANWFNQSYLSKIFSDSQKQFYFYGKLKIKGKNFILYPSKYEEFSENNFLLGKISPKYPLTQGISEKWLKKRIYELLDLMEKEIIICDEKIFPDLKENLKKIHSPQSSDDFVKATSYLEDIELTSIHLKIQNNISRISKEHCFDLLDFEEKIKLKISSLPYELTDDQINIISSILKNLKKGNRLNSLIQGDVGTGKTIIAFILSYFFYINNLQSIIICPTTILANQHFENFKKIFPELETEVSLITSESKSLKKSSPILIGTTSILSNKEKLIKNLGLIVIDEQHKFGVKQKEQIFVYKSSNINYLEMTATPIPRTVAESFFGDLEIFYLNTKPKFKKDIKTFLVPEEKREDCFKWIEDKIKNEKEQVYWVFPLISESSNEVNSFKKNLEKGLQELTIYFKKNVSFVHGKIKSDIKQNIMKQFSAGEFSILASTTVIEVGIDNPNANIICIETPEAYGLAQLHQIRGRVGRGEKTGYCFLFTHGSLSDGAKKRLDYFSKTTSGNLISEFDLQRRGPGEVYGTKQSGIPNLKIAKLNNLEKIQKTKLLALNLIKKNINEIQLFS